MGDAMGGLNNASRRRRDRCRSYRCSRHPAGPGQSRFSIASDCGVDDGGIGGHPGRGGGIEFSDPRGPVPLMYLPTVKVDVPGFLSAGLGEQVLPETGLILLFPSWLLRHVAAYTGDGTRISVAVNFSL